MKLPAVAILTALAATALADEAPRPGNVVRVEHRDPGALPTRGPSNALVTIELFFTPWVHSRHAAYRAIEKLQADHPTRIRLVYRILSNGSSRTPYAALEAHAEGKFFELMDELAKERTTPTTPKLLEIGTKIGIDPQRLSLAVSKPPAAYEAVIEDNDRRRRRKIRNPSLPAATFNGAATAQVVDGKPKPIQLTSLMAPDLENNYQRAYDRAVDLVDRGVDPRSVLDTIDQGDGPDPVDIAITAGPIDEELCEPRDPVLASPALDLAGLPSYGPPNADVTIVVMCSPTSAQCRTPREQAKKTHDIYPKSVRVVWGPFFDVSREDAADLALLADAALCAEKLGARVYDDRPELFDPQASPGWLWMVAVSEESSNRRRRLPVDQMIDKVADKLDIDHRAFSACRAQVAGTSLGWIEGARHAGACTTPATVIGGRIYPPITDPNTLQSLVEAELGPSELLRWAREHLAAW